MNEVDYIDTDNILKKIRNFEARCFGDEPRAIKLIPIIFSSQWIIQFKTSANY